MSTNKPRPYPNLFNTQHEKVRQKIDNKFHDRFRALDDCYYGTTTAWDKEGLCTKRKKDGWKDGGKDEFEGHKPKGKKDAKELFDQLQALINWDYELAKCEINDKMKDGYPDITERSNDTAFRKQIGQCIDGTKIKIKRTLNNKTELSKTCAKGGK